MQFAVQYWDHNDYLGRSYERIIVSVVSDVSCVGWLGVARSCQKSNRMTVQTTMDKSGVAICLAFTARSQLQMSISVEEIVLFVQRTPHGCRTACPRRLQRTCWR